MTPRGIALLKAWEGIKDGDPSTVNLDPYRDPLGYWTIGYGHLLLSEQRKLHGLADREEARALYPNGITKEGAELLLQADARARENAFLKRSYPLVLEPHQQDALISFIFNLSESALFGSTLWKLIVAGKRKGALIYGAFLAYRKGRKCDACPLEVVPGLERRRRAEATLFLKNELIFP